MNTYGIAFTPVIPMRKEPGEREEMVSQILFGELFSILDAQDNWLYIETLHDSYQGWISANMATCIDEEEFENYQKSHKSYLAVPSSVVKYQDAGRAGSINLSAGSVFYNVNAGIADIPGRKYFLNQNNISTGAHHDIIKTAMEFLNVPYLWGGRNVMGMDCSGFVQIVYRLNGVELPRDASQQISVGETVSDRNQILPGDLLFFGNDNGGITHVGIAIDPENVIHCAADVHIDTLNDEGIFNRRLNKQTHRNLQIKRFVYKNINH